MRPTDPGSFWLDRAPVAPRPLLEGARRVDVAVVGGGIAGATLARALALGGATVALLEGDRVGRGASGRNAGFLLAEAAETAAELARTHGRATAQAVREAGLATREVVGRIAGDAASDVGLRRTGSLRLAQDAAEDDDFRASARIVGPPLAHLPPSAIPAGYAAFRAAGGLVDPDDGVVHPVRLLRAALAQAERAGAFVAERSPVLRIEEAVDDVRVSTPHGTVDAESVVVATNAWISTLLPGGPLVRPVRAQMLAARLDPEPAWPHPVYANRGGEYARRLDDGTFFLGGLRRIGGATEETDDARPADPVQPALEALLARLAGDGAKVRVVARWAGTMGFTPDGLPAVGLAPGHDRVHVLGGFSGHGMGWGPGLATALADELLGREARLAPCFDPARDALRAGSVPPAEGGG